MRQSRSGVKTRRRPSSSLSPNYDAHLGTAARTIRGAQHAGVPLSGALVHAATSRLDSCTRSNRGRARKQTIKKVPHLGYRQLYTDILPCISPLCHPPSPSSASTQKRPMNLRYLNPPCAPNQTRQYYCLNSLLAQVGGDTLQPRLGSCCRRHQASGRRRSAGRATVKIRCQNSKAPELELVPQLFKKSAT